MSKLFPENAGKHHLNHDYSIESAAMTPSARVREIHDKLQEMGDPQRARMQQRFFKTGPGEYGEGDIFAGIPVPEIRKLVRRYGELSIKETTSLLQSPIHEARLLALLILIGASKRGGADLQEKIYHIYLGSTRFINSWDLVDVSAEHIVGRYLRHRSKEPLYLLAASPLLWERRIAIVATFHFIRQGEFTDTLEIAALLLNDPEDLIHKAVGWMLREVGKRDRMVEKEFLKAHYRHMPRTMLRYAIERFPEELGLRYLKGTVGELKKP